MKYLYSWLKQLYPALPDISTLIDLLPQLGHNVERIEQIQFSGIVIAKINQIDPHPNADRLSVVIITDGTNEYRVVCGAPDLTIDQKVAFAPVNTKLPNGTTLKKASIRGVDSEGMLCAEDELGLGIAHQGLLSLPQSAKLGASLDSVIEDYLITVDLTPNRGDVLSHFGLVRDIAAGTEKTSLTPQFQEPEYLKGTEDLVRIEMIHPDSQALSLGVVEFDQPSSTPLYMQCRLALLGQKSINLPTDITNYLLLEYGQPLHTYDADKLESPFIFSIRRAKDKETFAGLNGKSYTLTPQALVITNHDQPISLAGVLGGEATKVDAASKRIIFESAHFYPKPIQIMARGLNCLTESAIRWERGVDYNLMLPILKHAQALLIDLSHGRAYEPTQKENESENVPPYLDIDIEALNQAIGSRVESSTITTILSGLGCQLETKEHSIAVQPPSWRNDLQIQEDYEEEIIRIIGIDTLTKTPLSPSAPLWKRSKFWRQEQLKDILVSLGGHEIVTYPFVTQEELLIGNMTEKALELVDPALEGKKFMRTNLIPTMFEAIANNPETPEFSLFEVAKTYQDTVEIDYLCITVSGNNSAYVDMWWQNLFERLRLPVSSWMGRVVAASDELRGQYKIRKSTVTYLTLPLVDVLSSKLFENPSVKISDLDAITYMPVSKFQASRRDIAINIETIFTPELVTQQIKGIDSQIAQVDLFDTYIDPKLGENRYSLAFHILYQSPDKTLTNEEVQTIHAKVETYVKEHYHATIR